MEPEKSIGRAVRAERLRRGLSQGALAEKANIERDYVSRIELAKCCMSISILWRISAALDMRPSALLALAEKMTHGPAEMHSPPVPAPPRR